MNGKSKADFSAILHDSSCPVYCSFRNTISSRNQFGSSSERCPPQGYRTRSLVLLREFLFQLAQRLEAMAFVFCNPILLDLLNRHRVEIVAFLSPMPDDDHEPCFFQQVEMLGDRLARHVEVFAELVQRQSIVIVKPVKQMPAARIGKRFENQIQRKYGMQPYSCMSSLRFVENRRFFPVTCGNLRRQRTLRYTLVALALDLFLVNPIL